MCKKCGGKLVRFDRELQVCTRCNRFFSRGRCVF